MRGAGEPLAEDDRADTQDVDNDEPDDDAAGDVLGCGGDHGRNRHGEGGQAEHEQDHQGQAAGDGSAAGPQPCPARSGKRAGDQGAAQQHRLGGEPHLGGQVAAGDPDDQHADQQGCQEHEEGPGEFVYGCLLGLLGIAGQARLLEAPGGRAAEGVLSPLGSLVRDEILDFAADYGKENVSRLGHVLHGLGLFGDDLVVEGLLDPQGREARGALAGEDVAVGEDHARLHHEGLDKLIGDRRGDAFDGVF